MEIEIARLKGEAKVLERDFRRIPFLFALGVSAVPAYLVWGPTAALWALICTPCLVITAYYLIGVRRAENKQAIEELERQLASTPP